MDLLDHLAEVESLEGDDGLNHVLYPNMSLVCGLDLLTVLRASRGRSRTDRRFAVGGPAHATCPGCLSAYSAEVSAGMQRRQAVIRS